MMKLKISGDKLTLASAHMLSRHDKCARLHGHNYEIEVEIEGELNDKNMIIDFGEVKEKIAAIFKKYDHKVLIPKINPEFSIETNEKEVKIITCESKRYRFPISDVVLLPIISTTVEILSQYFHGLIKKEYPQFKITLTMHETPTSAAIYSE